MADQFLDTSIEFIKGVGPKRAELLGEELHLNTFGDLLFYFPFRYEDRSKFYKVSEIHGDLPYVQLKGQITFMEEMGDRYRKRLVAKFRDDSGSVDLVWFKGVSYFKKVLKTNQTYILFAKPNLYKGHLNLVHPELQSLEEYQSQLSSKISPVYPSTEKLGKMSLGGRQIQKLSRNLLQKAKGRIPENISDEIRSKYALINREQAIFQIHFPENAEELKKARFRMKFEELFFIQLEMLKLKLVKLESSQGYVFSQVGDYLNQFYEKYLSFDLTGAQKRVLKEIRKDLGSGKQMNRLLQGDVGSGKTIVAVMSMLIALDNGFQAAMMAPTEILATQHYESLKELLEPLGVRFALLTGSTPKADRIPIHEALEDGSMQILVGTHALLEDKVKFKQLGLAVIDEQHRFGVAQRARLWKKSKQAPHVLIMTATPIPRTLAMTLYGDLDVSTIDELPPGRKPIKTIHWYESKRLRLFGFMEEEIAKGRQIYVVYPLIEESAKMDYANLEEGFQHIFKRFAPPKYKVSIVHGKMPADKKNFEMDRFVNGETDIMVSTTVIEVGVNVPNASVMIIESAERFGLSQLHQLRGRVGRGAEQSFCVLMTGNKLSSDSRTRMQTMVETNDGFRISEVDLQLRGPGDLTGTQQSGLPINLKLTDLARDGRIIKLAREAAEDLLNRDPDLAMNDHSMVKHYIQQQKKGKMDWSRIA
ncbi:MAG: ATP-dependent DNA helicase RecG [Flavobacteriales bacterium]|nr:ATP-dependent DNA helicase RecG [Flavobacteriales bacterium]